MFTMSQQKIGKLLSLKDAGKILNVSERTMHRYIHSGRLKATKIGYWKISENDILLFLHDNQNIQDKMNRVYIKIPKKK